MERRCCLTSNSSWTAAPVFSKHVQRNILLSRIILDQYFNDVHDQSFSPFLHVELSHSSVNNKLLMDHAKRLDALPHFLSEFCLRMSPKACIWHDQVPTSIFLFSTYHDSAIRFVYTLLPPLICELYFFCSIPLLNSRPHLWPQSASLWGPTDGAWNDGSWCSPLEHLDLPVCINIPRLRC